MEFPLGQSTSVESVENVFLFVADSVTTDATSRNVTNLGVSGNAIAPSTYTASSFPSLVSGDYPASHCVWSFDNQLPERPSLLSSSENFGLSASTIWTDLEPSEKPPFQMIKATGEDAKELADLEPPFISIEHHKGGHMPYGFSFEEYPSSDEFFEEYRPSISELPNLYEKSVEDAESVFLERVGQLKERGLLDKTLVIYTSDHGESLGEPENGGTIGHGDPIVPDLVNVPLVFAGAGLPDANFTATVSGVDIAPTALSALGDRDTERCDGRDLWTGIPEKQRRCRSERWVTFDAPVVGEIERYRAASVWDSNGGIVFQRGNPVSRCSLAAANEFYRAPWAYLNRDIRHHQRIRCFFKKYLEREAKYGDPQFTPEQATEDIPSFRLSSITTEGGVDKDQLRKLGYLE